MDSGTHGLTRSAWAAVLAVVVAFGLAVYTWLNLRSMAGEVSVRVVGDDLVVSQRLVDAPFVVTHVIAYPPSGRAAGRLVADAGLPSAIDGEAVCRVGSLSKLPWRDGQGRHAALPRNTKRFAVVWHRVNVTPTDAGDAADAP